MLHTDPAHPHLLGKPMVTMAKPLGYTLHFKTHADRLKVCAALGRDPNKDLDVTEEELKAHAKHFIRVPEYRGFESLFADQVRYGQRRDERIKHEKSLKQKIIDGMQQAVGYAKGGKAAAA